jgi:integrase
MGRPRKPYFRASDGWWVSCFNGAYQKLAKGRANKDEALQRFHELHLLEGVQRPTYSPSHTVASVIDLYLHLNASKYADRALEERRRYLQLFAEAHGIRPVNDRDCLLVHVEEWLAAHPEWKSDWARAQAVSVAMRPFNWAAKKRLIAANPFRGVEKAQGQPRRPMTDAEFRAVLKATGRARKFSPTTANKQLYPSDLRRRQRPSAGARFRQVLLFLRLTGCRPGEAARLEWDDIDLGNAVIVLRRHKTNRKTKKPRVIPLHPTVLKLLIVLRRLGQSGPRVFLTQRKTPWKRCNLAQRLQRAREAAGVPNDAKLYGLRHGFGTRAVLNGVDLKTLAERMGHTTTRMTEHYVHLAGQQAHLAAAMLRANGRRPGS